MLSFNPPVIMIHFVQMQCPKASYISWFTVHCFGMSHQWNKLTNWMKITNTDDTRYYWSWKSILIDKQTTSCDYTDSAPKSAVTEFYIMETPDLELSDAQTGAKAVPRNVLQESKLPSYSKMRLKKRFSTTIPLPDTLFSLWVGTLSSVVRFSVLTCCKWHTQQPTWSLTAKIDF